MFCMCFYRGDYPIYAAAERYDLYFLIWHFIISLWASHSLSASVSSLFHSFIYAAGELLPTIFIICFIVSMSELLTKTGINEAMISPLQAL